MSEMIKSYDDIFSLLPAPSDMLRERNWTASQAGKHGRDTGFPGRGATKRSEKKRHLVVMKLFRVPFKSRVSELPTIVVGDVGSV